MLFWLRLGLGLTRKTELHDTFESLKTWCVFARLPLPVIADCVLVWRSKVSLRCHSSGATHEAANSDYIWC